MQNKAIFLDRDGVINIERGEYTYKPDDFVLYPGVKEALSELKQAGYLLIIITNQGGIAKGLYTIADMQACHDKMQAAIGNLIDDIYFSTHHPDYSRSLGRKPGSLLFERALAKWNLNPENCRMIGDQERDLIPALKLGIPGIMIGDRETPNIPPPFRFPDLKTAACFILHPPDSQAF